MKVMDQWWWLVEEEKAVHVQITGLGSQTETNEASLVDLRGGDTEYDFGYNAQTSNAPTQSYSLNLWIR